MSGYLTQPPWEFLVSASPFALQSYELSRLNHAANLRKEIAHLLDQWLEENACAMLARWLIEQREHSLPKPHAPAHPSKASPLGGSASDNFPGDPPATRGPL